MGQGVSRNEFAGRVERRLSADERFHRKIGIRAYAKMNFEGSSPELGNKLSLLADLPELASGPHCAQPSQPQHAEGPSPDGE